MLTRLAGWWPRAALAGCLAVAAWSRLAVLSQSLWHDEIVTIQQYAQGGPRAIFLSEYIPNNHMLFSLLAWMSAELFGPGEVVWRLWSALPGLAAIGVAAWALWRWVSPPAGVLAALILTVAPLHDQLVTQARGYGLAFLAAAGMLAGVFMAPRRPRAGMAVFGVSGWVGIVTLPVVVLAFTGHTAALALRPALRRAAAAVFAAVGVASLVWYLPVLGDLAGGTGQNFGEPLAWHGPLTGVLLLVPLTERRGIAAFGFVLIVSSAWIVWRRDRLLFADLAAPLLVTFGLLTIARWEVADRFVSFLLVAVAGLAGAAGAAVWEWLAERAGAFVAGALALGGTAAVLLLFSGPGGGLSRLPHENFKEAALAAAGYDTVLASSARPEGLRFYLGDRLELVAPSDVPEAVCGAEQPRAYIEHPYGAEPVDTGCLQEAGARRVDVPQRSRGQLIRVWLLDEDRRGAG